MDSSPISIRENDDDGETKTSLTGPQSGSPASPRSPLSSSRADGIVNEILNPVVQRGATATGGSTRGLDEFGGRPRSGSNQQQQKQPRRAPSRMVVTVVDTTPVSGPAAAADASPYSWSNDPSSNNAMLQREKSKSPGGSLDARRAASCSSGPAHRRDSQQARIGAGITSVAQEMGDFVPQRRESAPVRGLAEIEMIDDPRLVGDGGGHLRRNPSRTGSVSSSRAGSVTGPTRRKRLSSEAAKAGSKRNTLGQGPSARMRGRTKSNTDTLTLAMYIEDEEVKHGVINDMINDKDYYQRSIIAANNKFCVIMVGGGMQKYSLAAGICAAVLICAFYILHLQINSKALALQTAELASDKIRIEICESKFKTIMRDTEIAAYLIWFVATIGATFLFFLGWKLLRRQSHGPISIKWASSRRRKQSAAVRMYKVRATPLVRTKVCIWTKFIPHPKFAIIWCMIAFDVVCCVTIICLFHLEKQTGHFGEQADHLNQTLNQILNNVTSNATNRFQEAFSECVLAHSKWESATSVSTIIFLLATPITSYSLFYTATGADRGNSSMLRIYTSEPKPQSLQTQRGWKRLKRRMLYESEDLEDLFRILDEAIEYGDQDTGSFVNSFVGARSVGHHGGDSASRIREL